MRKTFSGKTAVDDVSFDVLPGAVTGFLGPNGAGKSTTMRLMLGLDEGEGETLFDGRCFDELERPMRVVGAVLDASAVHPKRSARNHLRMLGAANGIGLRRVDEALEEVGLESVADQNPGGFSLGMRQRLGLAVAILGRPRHLILDEPANGLDPQGIHWLRDFLRDYARGERTVFVSSHLLSEMNMMAERLVVIGKGRTLHYGDVQSFVSRFSTTSIHIRSARLAELITILRAQGARDTPSDSGGALITGMEPAQLAEIAAAHGIVLHELTVQQASLEEAFLHATGEETEYTSTSSRRASLDALSAAQQQAAPSAPLTAATTIVPGVPTGQQPAPTQPASPAPMQQPRYEEQPNIPVIAAEAARGNVDPTAIPGLPHQAYGTPYSQGQPPASQQGAPTGPQQPHVPHHQAPHTMQPPSGPPHPTYVEQPTGAQQVAPGTASMPVAQAHEQAIAQEAHQRYLEQTGGMAAPWQEPVTMHHLGFRTGEDPTAPRPGDAGASPIFADVSAEPEPDVPQPQTRRARREQAHAEEHVEYNYGASRQQREQQGSADSARPMTVGWNESDAQEAAETWMTSAESSKRGAHAAPSPESTDDIPRRSRRGTTSMEWDLSKPVRVSGHGEQGTAANGSQTGGQSGGATARPPWSGGAAPAARQPAPQTAPKKRPTRRELREMARRQASPDETR